MHGKVPNPMKMRNLAIKDPTPSPPPTTSDKWTVLDSTVVGEPIILLWNKKWLPEARKANPALAIYFPQEVKNLERFKGSDDDIRAIHRAKKEWKAWIIR